MKTKKEIITEVLTEHKIVRYKQIFSECMSDGMDRYAESLIEVLKEAIPLLEQHGHHRTSNKARQFIK